MRGFVSGKEAHFLEIKRSLVSFARPQVSAKRPIELCLQLSNEKLLCLPNCSEKETFFSSMWKQLAFFE